MVSTVFRCKTAHLGTSRNAAPCAHVPLHVERPLASPDSLVSLKDLAFGNVSSWRDTNHVIIAPRRLLPSDVSPNGLLPCGLVREISSLLLVTLIRTSICVSEPLIWRDLVSSVGRPSVTPRQPLELSFPRFALIVPIKSCNCSCLPRLDFCPM